MANLEKIADELSNLTILEASELSKMLEEKWDVSAAAPVAAAAAPAELSEKGLLGEGSPSPLGADEEASTQAAREEGWS